MQENGIKIKLSLFLETETNYKYVIIMILLPENYFMSDENAKKLYLSKHVSLSKSSVKVYLKYCGFIVV